MISEESRSGESSAGMDEKERGGNTAVRRKFLCSRLHNSRVEFEKIFEIEISDEDIMSVKTVADVLEYIEKRIGLVQNSDILHSGQISW